MGKIKEEKKIQRRNRLYAFLRYYVDFAIHEAYQKIEYAGLEKIPKDGAIIYAPNHTNALMDALIILAIDRMPKVFVARADIFHNPYIVKILTFLKIMPIMRIRDSIAAVKKDKITFAKSVDVLKDKIPFCILPEGTHRAKHSLLPLSKGIFRIALQGEKLLKQYNTPLYIVPVGLEYGNFYRFRSTVLAQMGEPIKIDEYIDRHPNLTTPELINAMKKDLTDAMKKVILYIPDDDKYYATYEICAIIINEQVTEYLKNHPKERRHSLLTRYNANLKTVEQIEKTRKKKPQEIGKIFALTENAIKMRLSKKISLGSVIMKNPFWSRLIKFILLIITLPYTIPAGILSLPVTGVSTLLFKKMKDRAFFNSIRFVVTLVLWPLLIIIYAIIAFSLLRWWLALAIIAALVPATVITLDAYKLFRLIISDIKLMLDRKLRKTYQEIKNLYYEMLSNA